MRPMPALPQLTDAQRRAVRDGLAIAGVIAAAYMYVIVGDTTWQRTGGRRADLLGRQRRRSVRRGDGRRRERLPLLAGVRAGVRRHRPPAARGVHRRLDDPARGGRVVAGAALAGLAARARAAGQPGGDDRQHPPAARGGDRARVPLVRNVGVPAADQGHARARAAVVRDPAGVAGAGARARRDGRHQRRVLDPRAAGVGRLDRPAPA